MAYVPGFTYDVFLSYNARDSQAVERVGRWLKDRGLTCFMDRWYLVPGTSWPSALEQARAECTLSLGRVSNTRRPDHRRRFLEARPHRGLRSEERQGVMGVSRAER